MKRKSKLTIAGSHDSARRLGRRGRLRAGQVLAEIAERNRVLRLQGIRGTARSTPHSNRPDGFS